MSRRVSEYEITKKRDSSEVAGVTLKHHRKSERKGSQCETEDTCLLKETLIPGGKRETR